MGIIAWSHRFYKNQEHHMFNWSVRRFVFAPLCVWGIWNQVETPFAYMQLSPPAKEFRKAEWRSQNSSWPCLKHLTSLQISGVLHFEPWEAPVSPASPKYTQDITHCCSVTLKGAFKSSPEAGRLERLLSIHLAYAEPLVDKTGTKHFQGGKFRG